MSLKKQLRSLKRLLNKVLPSFYVQEDLSSDIKRDTERKIKGVEYEIIKDTTGKASEKERKIAKKYRMLKFFEKQKIVRKLQRKDLVEEERDKLEIDFNYVNVYYCPNLYSIIRNP